MIYSVYVLLTVLAGYLFLTGSNYFRFRIKSASGYHVFLQSALVGVVFWVVLYIPVRLFLPNEDLLGFSLTDKVLISCFLCYPLSALALLGANLACNRERALFKTAYDIGAFSEVLFQESMIGGELVEITTQNRKVYVGYILEYRHDLTSSYNEIFLVPVMSGYRTDDTMKVEFTTHYIPIYLEQLTVVDADQPTGVDADQLGELLVQLLIYSQSKFRLVIPVREMVSARYFEHDIYERFQEAPSSS